MSEIPEQAPPFPLACALHLWLQLHRTKYERMDCALGSESEENLYKQLTYRFLCESAIVRVEENEP